MVNHHSKRADLTLLQLANVRDQFKLSLAKYVLWPQLEDICNLENSNFLPRDIAKIVLILLAIRKNTFKNSPQRFAEDYIRYESEFNEDATQYYPMH